MTGHGRRLVVGLQSSEVTSCEDVQVDCGYWAFSAPKGPHLETQRHTDGQDLARDTDTAAASLRVRRVLADRVGICL